MSAARTRPFSELTKDWPFRRRLRVWKWRRALVRLVEKESAKTAAWEDALEAMFAAIEEEHGDRSADL